MFPSHLRLVISSFLIFPYSLSVPYFHFYCFLLSNLSYLRLPSSLFVLAHVFYILDLNIETPVSTVEPSPGSREEDESYLEDPSPVIQRKRKRRNQNIEFSDILTPNSSAVDNKESEHSNSNMKVNQSEAGEFSKLDPSPENKQRKQRNKKRSIHFSAMEVTVTNSPEVLDGNAWVTTNTTAHLISADQSKTTSTAVELSGLDPSPEIKQGRGRKRESQ